MLKYSLIENRLTERPDDYYAQIYVSSRMDKEAIITRMINKGTLLTRTDIIAAINSYEETIIEVLTEGSTVTTPLFNTSFSISGVFEGPMDTFDRNRHKLHINVSKGTLLRDTQKNIKFEKMSTSSPLPQIQEVKDSVSHLVNEILTPGGVAQIYGHNLKIEGEDPACGLWFISEDGTETKAEIVIENKPSRVIVVIPYLAAGEYRIKIATQFANGVKLLKTPKVFVYPKSLSVR